MQGFYIDVGAWSPDLDSVTRAFYERDWHGINIEPSPEFNSELRERRPRDINLCQAVGDQEGSLMMNFLSNSGLSTVDNATAKRHQQHGWVLDRQQVRVTRLADIWRTYVPTDQPVHFLKVDVEGYEEAVLKSNDWTANRPWVVVVEATIPMSQVESFKPWEPILLEANYVFAYADGLNRFYVAKEHSELLPALKFPPNVFDDFVLHREKTAEARATQAEGRVTQVEAQAEQAEAREAAVRDQLQQTLALVRQAQALAEQAHTGNDKLEAALLESKAQLAQTQEELNELHQANQRHVAELGATRKELHEVQQSNHFYWQLANQRQEEIETILGCTSIRMTAPLRWLGRHARSVNNLFWKSPSKQLLQRVGSHVQHHPWLRQAMLPVLQRNPLLKRRLKSILIPTVVETSDPPPAISNQGTNLDQLTPRARQIYTNLTNLKAVFAQQHQGQA